MMYSLLADLVLVVHLAFVVFVLCGGLLVLKWRWIAWLHLPAAVWGAVVEFTGWICPLTPLENWLRVQGGETGSQDDFIDTISVADSLPCGPDTRRSIAVGHSGDRPSMPGCTAGSGECRCVVLLGIDRVQSHRQVSSVSYLE